MYIRYPYAWCCCALWRWSSSMELTSMYGNRMIGTGTKETQRACTHAQMAWHEYKLSTRCCALPLAAHRSMYGTPGAMHMAMRTAMHTAVQCARAMQLQIGSTPARQSHTMPNSVGAASGDKHKYLGQDCCSNSGAAGVRHRGERTHAGTLCTRKRATAAHARGPLGHDTCAPCGCQGQTGYRECVRALSCEEQVCWGA